MAKVKEAGESANKNTTIDVAIVIAKFNANKESDTPKMDRVILAKLLKTHPQSFVNWNAGVTPKYLDSIFDAITYIQDQDLKTHFVENWKPSTSPTMFDHIIQLMQIGNCNIEDFVTRATIES